MAALLEGFKALGLGRLIAMGAVAGFMLLMLAFLALRGGGGEQMALLYADIDLREAAQINEQLDHAHIAHEIGPDGTRISVPAAEVARARLLLAKEGLPSGGSIGYEIFDRGDGLTSAAVQGLLRAVDKTKLPLALKGASEGLRDLFLKNLSERAGKMLRDDIEALGPVKLRDVDEAQAAIVVLAKDLAAQGTIEIGEGKDEELVY